MPLPDLTPLLHFLFPISLRDAMDLAENFEPGGHSKAIEWKESVLLNDYIEQRLLSPAAQHWTITRGKKNPILLHY